MLNQPQYAGASMLRRRRQFGCGSSREHAAWALQDAGFRVVIAPSFADIFRNNAIGNGMLPVALAEAAVDTILDRAEARATATRVEVDLERCEVRDRAWAAANRSRSTQPSRQRLLEGKDEIDVILAHESDIAAFEAASGIAQLYDETL